LEIFPGNNWKFPWKFLLFPGNISRKFSWKYFQLISYYFLEIISNLEISWKYFLEISNYFQEIFQEIKEIFPGNFPGNFLGNISWKFSWK
jgi:hypothetical protein